MFLSNRVYKLLWAIVFAFVLNAMWSKVIAQESNNEPFMHTEAELKASAQKNIISTVIKIKNSTADRFSGILQVVPDEGLRNISGSNLQVTLEKGDSIYVPVKLFIQPQLAAGKAQVLFILTDDKGKTVDKQTSYYEAEERVSLVLTIQNRDILITNANDSVRIETMVKNEGNKQQDVTVVFSIPTLQRGVTFVEKKTSLAPQEEKALNFSFLANNDLLQQRNFQVNIAAMYGRDKTLFSNASVTVQNASTHQRYVSTYMDFGLYNPYQQNSISISHRRTGFSSTGTTQMLGTGSIDLPAGYIGLSGNMYTYGKFNDLVATNTSLSYRLNRNEVMVGNIYESLELSASGRGAKAQTGVGKKSSIRVGFIDQQYNVFSRAPFFDNTYTLFAITQVGGTGESQKAAASILYQYDDMEKMRHTVAGGEINNIFGSQWHTDIKMYGAMSAATATSENQYSGAAELRYNGKIKATDFTGNYYYSSPYFPGNRRGALSLQQSIYTRFGKNFSFRTGGYFSRYAPKSQTLRMQSHSNQFSGDAEMYFPQILNVTPSIGYQNQFEQTNNYLVVGTGAGDASINAHRFKGSLRWSSMKSRQSFIASLEHGIADLSGHKQNETQSKLSLTFSYGWLNLTSSWQEGSFYLSDYYMAQRMGKKFRRFLTSLTANKEFADNKFTINGGANLTDDLYSHYSPSAFLNVRYAPSRFFSFYSNASWVSYQFAGLTTKDVWNIEGGITINLSSSKASAGRKSTVQVTAFHDENANGIFDKNERPAMGYKLKIDNNTFITNEKGRVTYSKVPFGTYYIDKMSERGWFSTADLLKVDKFKTEAFVPLQQAGSVSGQIEFQFDTRASIDTPPSKEGISFMASSMDGNVKQKIYSDKEGNFTVFLPTGQYTIELLTGSLHPDLTSESTIQTFEVKPGRIFKLKPFVLQVRQKKVNIKRFTQD